MCSHHLIGVSSSTFLQEELLTSEMHRCLADEKILQECYYKFRELRKLQRRVIDFAVLLEEKCGVLQRGTFVPAMYHVGFNKLPGEVLVRIADYLSQYERICLSHVDRSLRNVMRSASHLWNEISLSDSLSLIRIKLSLSRNAPLHIKLDSDDDSFLYDDKSIDVDKNFALLAEHSRRWHHVSFIWLALTVTCP